jgi:hypothetical protein
MSETKNESGDSRSEGGSVGADPDAVRQAFGALPFEQKFSTLIQIELDILGDAVDTVVSAASQVVDEIVSRCTPSEQDNPSTPGAPASASTS